MTKYSFGILQITHERYESSLSYILEPRYSSVEAAMIALYEVRTNEAFASLSQGDDDDGQEEDTWRVYFIVFLEEDAVE